MVYTCSCCKHIDFREWCRNYFCKINKRYMYWGSRQCQHFELKDDLKEDPFYNPTSMTDEVTIQDKVGVNEDV